MIKKSLFEKEIEKIKDIPFDFERNVSHLINKKILTRYPAEPRDVTSKDRMMHAAIGGLAALAATSIIPKIIARNKKLSIPLLLAGTASGIGVGYFSPDQIEMIKREVKGEVSPEKVKEYNKIPDEIDKKLFRETKEISELYSPLFKKQSSLGGVIGGTAGFLGRNLVKAPGRLWGATFPGKGANLGRRVLGRTMKTGLVGGALYGGYKGYQRLSAPKSGGNYTTFLRNQVLAGNVQPDELSQQDLVSVRKLGMR